MSDASAPVAATALLIDFGDLASLVALGMESDPARLVLWHRHDASETDSRRVACARAHISAFGAADLIVAEATASAASSEDLAHAAGLDQSRLLLDAAVAAKQRGISRIVFPYQAGDSFEAVGEVVERTHLVASLAGLGCSKQSVVIDLPVIDLKDEQLADLAQDLGVPMHQFWPCDHDVAEPCSTCPGCTRWQTAFAAVGIAWPWTAVHA